MDGSGKPGFNSRVLAFDVVCVFIIVTMATETVGPTCFNFSNLNFNLFLNPTESFFWLNLAHSVY